MQALAAASKTVDCLKVVHSLHAYFLLVGDFNSKCFYFLFMGGMNSCCNYFADVPTCMILHMIYVGHASVNLVNTEALSSFILFFVIISHFLLQNLYNLLKPMALCLSGNIIDMRIFTLFLEIEQDTKL